MLRRISLCSLAVVCFWCGSVTANPQCLEATRIRFREAVNSVHWEEADPLHAAGDAVAAWASDVLEDVGDAESAETYLSRLKTFADDALSAAGYGETGLAGFCRACKEWAEWKFFFIRNELSLFFGRKM